MALRDKLRDNATPFLRPDEQIQGVFCTQTTNPYWSLLSMWIVLFSNSYRTVVATDRRIIVLQNGRMSATKMKSVVCEFPRQTVIGPASGLWHKSESLGETMYINKRFHKDVSEIDSMSTGSTSAAPTGPPVGPPS